MPVTRSDIDAICAAFAGATVGTPPEELASWKVGGKMFATFGTVELDGVSVKCQDVETATMLIDAGAAEKAKYFHKSWVRLKFDATSLEDAEHRLKVSYDKVRSTLPKSIRDTLSEELT